MTKKAAMLDAVGIAPEVYKKSFDKRKIQESFVTVGEITNYGTSTEPKYIAIPNLTEMQKNARKSGLEKNGISLSKKLPLGVKEIMRTGYIKEE